MVNPLPGLPTSPPLAGPPGFAFALGDTSSPVGPLAPSSSSFLLPFPAPLAGESAECRREGADPAEGGER